MQEDIRNIQDYLSLRYENEEEEKYLLGLINQFENTRDFGSYHLALFAYHLLFMSFVYQTIYKIKIWMPDNFKLALATFPVDIRREYMETNSSWVYSKINERTIFGLLHLLKDCENLISRCKKIVDFRNENLGHANPFIVSEDEFEKNIFEYNKTAKEIHELTHEQLAIIFDKYIKGLEKGQEITKDDLKLNLINPNRLSDVDLEKFGAECTVNSKPLHKKLKTLLEEDFNIYIQQIDKISS